MDHNNLADDVLQISEIAIHRNKATLRDATRDGDNSRGKWWTTCKRQCGTRPRPATCKSFKWRSKKRHAHEYGERAVGSRIIVVAYIQHWYGNSEIKRRMGYISYDIQRKSQTRPDNLITSQHHSSQSWSQKGREDRRWENQGVEDKGSLRAKPLWGAAFGVSWVKIFHPAWERMEGIRWTLWRKDSPKRQGNGLAKCSDSKMV